MQLKTYLLSIFGLLLINACSSPESESSAQIDNNNTNDSTIVLEGLNKSLMITLPKSLTSRFDIEQGYNPNFGQLELRVGEGFALNITEEKLSMLSVKEELENDQLFTYSYQTENDTELVYQSALPDGQPHSYEFVKVRRFNDFSIVIRTEPMNKFNQSQLQVMEDAVRTLTSQLP